MHLTQRILGFTLLGSDWVLWVLIALSILSVAVMVERALCFAGTGGSTSCSGARCSNGCWPPIAAGGTRSSKDTGPRRRRGRRRNRRARRAAPMPSPKRWPGRKARLRSSSSVTWASSARSATTRPSSACSAPSSASSRRSHDLSRNQASGAGAVMSGISEALVATAVGLHGRHPGGHRLQHLPAARPEGDGRDRRHRAPGALARSPPAIRTRPRTGS